MLLRMEKPQGLFTAVTMILAAILLSVGHAHPSPNQPPPKWSMQGHSHGHLYGMINEVSRENPVLKEELRTDISQKEVEDALEFHNRAVSQHLASFEVQGIANELGEDLTAAGDVLQGAERTDVDAVDAFHAQIPGTTESTEWEDAHYPTDIHGSHSITLGGADDNTVEEDELAGDPYANVEHMLQGEAVRDESDGVVDAKSSALEMPENALREGQSDKETVKEKPQKYPMEIEGPSPYGADDIRKELAKEIAKRAAQKESQ